jgi:hypothetical protein
MQMSLWWPLQWRCRHWRMRYWHGRETNVEDGGCWWIGPGSLHRHLLTPKDMKRLGPLWIRRVERRRGRIWTMKEEGCSIGGGDKRDSGSGLEGDETGWGQRDQTWVVYMLKPMVFSGPRILIRDSSSYTHVLVIRVSVLTCVVYWNWTWGTPI